MTTTRRAQFPNYDVRREDLNTLGISPSNNQRGRFLDQLGC